MGREGVSEGNGVLVYPIGWRAVCATSECHLALISTSEYHQWTLCVVVTRGGSSQKGRHLVHDVINMHIS